MRQILDGTRRAAGLLTAALLGWMVLLALLQLLYRWMGISGLQWADVHLRQLVLWLGLLGGVLAAADRRHIRIDLTEHYLKGKAKQSVVRGINGVAAGIAFYLLTVSLRFIASERSSGLMVNGVLLGWSAPLWWIETIIPIALLLIGIFFLGEAVAPSTANATPPAPSSIEGGIQQLNPPCPPSVEGGFSNSTPPARLQ